MIRGSQISLYSKEMMGGKVPQIAEKIWQFILLKNNSFLQSCLFFIFLSVTFYKKFCYVGGIGTALDAFKR